MLPLAVHGLVNGKGQDYIGCARLSKMRRVGLPLAVLDSVNGVNGKDWGLLLAVLGLVNVKGRAPIGCCRLSEYEG
jgi:hypothetical protein